MAVAYELILIPAEPRRRKYVLELGVDKPGDDGQPERVCALEVGPFMRMSDARRFGMWARGMSSADLSRRPYAQPFDLPADEIEEHGWPITGATLNTYTDELGTTENTDLY